MRGGILSSPERSGPAVVSVTEITCGAAQPGVEKIIWQRAKVARAGERSSQSGTFVVVLCLSNTS